MSGFECVNYSKQEIVNLLEIIKQLTENGNYIISKTWPSRKNNLDFEILYDINDCMYRKLISSILADEFCYSVKNDNPNFPEQDLFVFWIERELTTKFGVDEFVGIYIKVKLDVTDEEETIVFISFHKSDMPIAHLF